MKKVLTLLTIVVVILFASCSPETVEDKVEAEEKMYGSLVVTTSSNQRTIEPTCDERHPVSYIIHVDSSSLNYSKTFTSTEVSYTVENLEAGEYQVYVEGLNASGSAIVKSDTQTLTITNMQTTSAVFKLSRYIDGKGTIDFTVAVPKNDDSVDGVVFTIYKASDTALENPEEYIITGSEFSQDGKYRCYVLNKDLTSGSYNLGASMFKLNADSTRTQVGFTHIDAAHIYGGLTSSSTLIWDKEFFPAVPSPVIDTESGTCKDGQKVRITCPDSRAAIYYTLDGTTPTTESERYVNPVEIEGNTKLRAIAVLEGLVDSLVASADYTVYVESPVFSLPNNSMVDGDSLSITCGTDGAKIIYTTDGTDPTLENGKEYTKAFMIRNTMEVKAVAYKEGYETSLIVSASYYDISTETDASYFTITSKGQVSVNSDMEDKIPSVLVIPSSINGIDVVEIASNGFKGLTSIEYLSIPTTVVTIGNNAFAGCTNIKSVTISEYVTKLNSTAFTGWTADQRINDYSGLVKAGTLTNCQAKVYVTIKAGTQTISGYTGMDTLYGISLANDVTSIADNAFSGCTNLEEFTLPSYVTTIGSLAFNGCTKISSITLPDVLKSVVADAFKGWTESQKIIDNSGLALTNGKFSDSEAKVYTTTPTTMTEITSDTVRNRDDIYGLEIKSSVKTIADYAFEGSGIESIVIPATVETLGLEIFKSWSDNQAVQVVYDGYTAIASSDGTSTPFTNSDAIYSVSFASGVTVIGDNAFNGMSSLTSISIPDTVTMIGADAFKSTALNAITLSKDTTSIGDGAFENCFNLSSVTLPDKVTSIGSRAFYNDDVLKSIIVPDSVTSIGDEIFADCDNLKSVTLGRGITSIPQKAFDGSSMITSITASGCMESLEVTVKVPINQLIVHDVVISVTPMYSSVYTYRKEFSRSDETVEGDYRVYTYSVDSLLGLYYDVDVQLTDYEGVLVGEKHQGDTVITAGSAVDAEFTFAFSDLASRVLASPVISPSGDTCVDGGNITITSSLGGDIYYTLNGTTPSSSNGALYTEPIVLHDTATIKAIAYKEGYQYSTVSTAAYSKIKVAAPEATPSPADVYPASQSVELTTATDGAVIYYSLTGETPATEYTSPIRISETSTITAVAKKDGYEDSDTVTFTYAVNKPSHEIVNPTKLSLEINATLKDGTYTFVPVWSSAVNASYEWRLDGVVVSTASTYSTSTDLRVRGHYIELEATVNGISYSADLFTEDLRITRTVDLNSEWVEDTSLNPDSKTYEGAYKSNSNYNVASKTATMKITVGGVGDFTLYVRSDAETTNDYLVVYKLDSTSEILVSTSGNQNSTTEISGYTKVVLNIPYDGEKHVVTISYLKNASTNSGADRGFVLIPEVQH